MDYLRRIGCYRLSAYWYPFPDTSLQQDPISKKLTVVRSEQFIEGARFQDALDLYVFDKRLRLLLLDAIERIEIAVRVDIAHLLGEHDAFAHTNPALLHGNFTKKIKPKPVKRATRTGSRITTSWSRVPRKISSSTTAVNTAGPCRSGLPSSFGILACCRIFIRAWPSATKNRLPPNMACIAGRPWPVGCARSIMSAISQLTTVGCGTRTLSINPKCRNQEKSLPSIG